MSNYQDVQERKKQVALAVEDTLLEMGQMVKDAVSHRLQKEYNCQLCDCIECPEYLRIILKEYFGDAYDVLLDSIKDKLGEAELIPIQQFITVMERK